MTSQQRTDELEIRRKSHELAVAWTRGRAAFVLDAFCGEQPVVAALIATLVHETLARWDPYDSKWPNAFRHALLLRSQGLITPDELEELEREYRRVFGSKPPLPPHLPSADIETAEQLAHHVRQIRAALASGRPIVRERGDGRSPRFLRLQPARN